jgi:hypothetical protein
LKPDEDLKELGKQLPHTIRFSPTEIEGCGWDGDELLLVSENRLIYGLRPR